MATFLDHTIVPVKSREEAVEFYSRIFGFEDVGEVGPFLAVRVNDTFMLDFQGVDDFQSHHYAFGMESQEFEAAFAKVKESGIAYGDHSYDHENMKGPGMTFGVKGMGKAGYFDDPIGRFSYGMAQDGSGWISRMFGGLMCAASAYGLAGLSRRSPQT